MIPWWGWLLIGLAGVYVAYLLIMVVVALVLVVKEMKP